MVQVLKRLSATFLLTVLMFLSLGLSDASASPLSYTQYHCVKFARAVENERWATGVREIRYLSRSYTVNTVEIWADAWLYSPTARNLRGLVRSCYNTVF